MISFIALKKNPAVFQSFTGLTLLAFYKLLSSFEQAYEDDLVERDRERSTPRQRERGGGRTGTFKRLEDKLVFILFYFKFYPVQEVQGFFFGMGQSQAWEWIHRLTPILNRALGYEKQLPARKTSDVGQILESCPGLEFIIDGTERPIRRPKDKERRQKYYSGKKKRHTLKNNVVSEKRTRKVKVLSETCEGKKHDKKLADEQDVHFPKGSKVWKDTGFQGYEPEDVITYQPKKKPKGKELTPEEKEQNRLISSERIGVEHSIGGIKVFAIVREIYRNMTIGFEDLIMETACGLHNLRLDYPLSA
jgi:hypothetical protein